MNPHLEHSTEKVRQLIESYRTGRILIPEFQREFIWKPNKAAKLIDSLYRGFPISSLLLWESFGEVRTRNRKTTPSRSGRIGWLIDGQQRVIMLARAMSGEDGIDVVFNPHSEEFRLVNAATKNDRTNWYHVSQVCDDEQYRLIRRGLDGLPGGDRVEARLEVLRRVVEYEIPIAKMIDYDFSAAVEVFTRINTLGQKLGKQDIESARVAAKHAGFIADEVSPFLHTLRQQGFGRMNIMHLFRACAFIAQPDGRSRTLLHELPANNVRSAWKKTEKAIQEALGVIRSEFGLLNMDILWSGSLLVPLIALCAERPTNRNAREMLAGWPSPHCCIVIVSLPRAPWTKICGHVVTATPSAPYSPTFVRFGRR